MPLDARRYADIPPSVSVAAGCPFRSLALALSALALLVQAFVVQTHVHLPSRVEAGAGTGLRTSPAPAIERHRSGEAPATCPVCQALASAGNYMVPGWIALAMPLSTFGATAAAPLPARAERRSPLGWRNRGPPVSRP